MESEFTYLTDAFGQFMRSYCARWANTGSMSFEFGFFSSSDRPRQVWAAS